MSHESPLEEKHAPVVELALLRIIPPFTITDPTLRTSNSHARQSLEKHSDNPFHVYTQVEDPAYMYLIGSWPTRAEHLRFITSGVNKELLAGLEAQIKVEWMFHIDVAMNMIPLEAPILSIGRYKMAKRDVHGYAATFASVQGPLDEYVAPHRWAHGRRIDPEVMDDGRGSKVELKHLVEYVLFCGGKRAEQPSGFAKTGAFEEFGAAGAHLLDTDVKHAMRLRWENEAT